MKRIVIAAALAISSGACVQKEVITTGPMITVTIDSESFGSSCESDSSDGSLGQDDMAYSLSFVVDAIAGKAEAEDFSVDTEYHPVTTITGTLGVPGITIPESTFDIMTSTFSEDRTFTRHDPIVLPGTAMGQMLSVTLEATDSEGLKGNVIDFACLLE